MEIDHPIALAAADDGRKVWVTPSIIPGTLSDAEGGNYRSPESVTGNGFAAS